MQKKDAQRLREKSGEPCNDPSYDKEYDLGGDTGDLVCTNCGFYDYEHEEDDE